MVETFNPSNCQGDIDNPSDLFIGRSGGGSNHFGGKLNYIRIYNRVLSATEAEDLYDYEASEHLELLGTAKMSDINSSTYSEVVNLFRDNNGTIVRINESSNGVQIGNDISVFNDDWMPRGISVVDADGTGNEDIAVSAINMSTGAAVTRIMNTSGNQIGNDIDLLQ